MYIFGLPMDKDDEESLLDLGHCVLYLLMSQAIIPWFSWFKESTQHVLIAVILKGRINLPKTWKFTGFSSKSRDFEFTDFELFTLDRQHNDIHQESSLTNNRPPRTTPRTTVSLFTWPGNPSSSLRQHNPRPTYLHNLRLNSWTTHYYSRGPPCRPSRSSDPIHFSRRTWCTISTKRHISPTERRKCYPWTSNAD